jgi:hypothetical protein
LRGGVSFARSASIAFGSGGGAEDVGVFAVLNGSTGGPPNGALDITTVRKTSGRVSAHHPASGDPASCPTTFTVR